MDNADYEAVIADDERLIQSLDEAWTADQEKAVEVLVMVKIPKALARELVKEVEGTTAEELVQNALNRHHEYKGERKSEPVISAAIDEEAVEILIRKFGADKLYARELVNDAKVDAIFYKKDIGTAEELASEAKRLHNIRVRQEKERERELEKSRCRRCGNYGASEEYGGLCYRCAKREYEEEELHRERMRELRQKREREYGYY